MRRIIRYLLKKTISPLLKWRYNSFSKKKHKTVIEEMPLEIHPLVFNPVFFFSTKTIIRFLKTIPVRNKRFLELGSGSGTISVWAAREGAFVTATDISPAAINNTNKNATLNNVIVQTRQTSLFENIDLVAFEIIIINPPYYPKTPITIDENAWYCGEHFEYFTELFDQIRNVSVLPDIYMILSEDCNISVIKQLASQCSLSLNCCYESKFILEYEYIYKIDHHRD